MFLDYKLDYKIIFLSCYLMISKIYFPKWTIQVFNEERICALSILQTLSIQLPYYTSHSLKRNNIFMFFFSFGILTILVTDLEKVLLLLTIVQ